MSKHTPGPWQVHCSHTYTADPEPEALRLADALDRGTYLLSRERQSTAAELRRLHEVNAELLEALNWIAAHDLRGADLKAGGWMAYGLVHKARAAINKAREPKP